MTEIKSEISKVRPARGGKNGSSLIITIPKQICEALKIKAGNHVKATIQNKNIVLEKI